MMETELKETTLLKFGPNTVESVRKSFNLDQLGRMEEALNIIEEWIQKQEHFLNKNFDRGYLERFLINNKGHLEKVKARLDKKCTVINLTKIIGPYNVKEFKHLVGVTYGLMPVPTEDFRRVIIARANPNHVRTSESWIEFNKANAMLLEYLLRYDYMLGYDCIVDLMQVNLLDIMTSMDMGSMREYQRFVLGSLSLRVRSVHVLTTSKVAENFVGLLKQILSTFKYEIYVHRSMEDLHQHIPRELLPKDYGGEQDTLDDIHKKIIEVLSSEGHLNHLRWVQSTRTDESRRSADKFNEVMGVQGSFRTLNVD